MATVLSRKSVALGDKSSVSNRNRIQISVAPPFAQQFLMPPWLARTRGAWGEEEVWSARKVSLYWSHHGGLGRGWKSSCHMADFTGFFKDLPYPISGDHFTFESIFFPGDHWWVLPLPQVSSAPPASFCFLDRILNNQTLFSSFLPWSTGQQWLSKPQCSRHPLAL